MVWHSRCCDVPVEFDGDGVSLCTECGDESEPVAPGTGQEDPLEDTP
jgi:hypothetical protein